MSATLTERPRLRKQGEGPEEQYPSLISDPHISHTLAPVHVCAKPQTQRCKSLLPQSCGQSVEAQGVRHESGKQETGPAMTLRDELRLAVSLGVGSSKEENEGVIHFEA